MERARRWEGTARRPGERRRSRSGGRSGRRGVALGPRERRRLLQLCVCTVIFLVVFLGRGALPGDMEEVRWELLRVIRTDTDFKSVFASLGEAVNQGESGAEAVSQVWKQVLGVEGENWRPYVFAVRDTPLYREEVNRVADGGGNLLPSEALWRADQEPEFTEPDEGEPAGEEMTDELGVGETVAPVLAPVSSGFGLREHPIEGGEKFHNGLDLAAPYGDDIKAFAAGVVDYIGESPAYGQYLQIRHAGGVTSFYAHCSLLCVQPGQQVAAGEKVAEVGDTGEVTGAHLHFELRVDGELVDPAGYIQTE